MASGRVTLSYTTISNGATSATVRITMTYYGNGETWNSSPSSNNCYITLPSPYGTKYFTHAYTTSTSAQTMGYVDFTIIKTHSTQSLTATGGITNYSTYYSNPTGSCTVSVSAQTSYTVTYNANGKGTSPSSQTKWYGESLTLRPAMTYSGWTFVGWNTSSTATTAQYNASGSYTTNAAATLYAIWKKEITLSYNANNGSGAPASQTNTIYNTTTSTSFTIPSTRPTRSNYNFLGWLDGSNLYQPGDTISNVAANKELVASWELAYIPPQITSLEGKRSESSNSQSDITVNWTKGNDGSDINETQLLIAYKLNTSSTWTYVTNTTGSTSSTETWINSSNTTYSTTISTPSDSQYDIQVKVRNENYTSYAQTKTSFISATFYVIDITADGKGIGLLTSAPTAGINVSTAIKNLGASGLSATGTGGIAIGARNSTNDISSAGSGSIASGFAQGGSIEATTKGAFAGGLADGNNKITASGTAAFAFGQSNSTAALTASGNGAIAMGLGCTASGAFSLTHNMYTTAAKRAQTVIGTWNIIDNNTSSHPAGTSGTNAEYGKYAFIIGNGTSSARSNAFAVTWNGKVELNSEPLFKWTQIGSGTNTTSKITFSSATTNYNEIMVVASTERNGGYHLFSGILPAALIDSTDREFKLSGGVGATASTTCGAWGKIVTTGFTPVGVWINSTAFTSTTTWYIYGR